MRKIRRSKNASLVLVLLLAPAVLAGCGREPATSADVAVSIDGEEIHYSQFETYLRDHESYLLRSGLIAVTPQGRIAAAH